MIDLDDTSNCPVDTECSVCGARRRTLRVRTADSMMGVHCLTTCDPCSELGSLSAVSPVEAVRRVLDHCEHLGITVDEMAEAMLA